MSMTNNELESARTKYSQARALWEAAKTKADKRDAAEDMEFWGNKAAMLSIKTGWAK